MSIERALQSVRELRESVRAKNPPPEEGAPSPEEPVIYFSLVRNSRGYLERLVHQINGSYEHGWYDASAVMIRRLVETLIIEVYEKYGLADHIKTVQGDFFYLRDLISSLTAQKEWNLSKNAKSALPRLKDVGDMSAHSRRFIAQRQDIDRMMADLRVIVQELMTLAELK
ncbi:DUF4145 domain-containing protein [Pseudomonas sp. Irchel s3a10]|uniref:DUF4145 domain-containing protein n=1 Tax=Pseudomonas sp. Irchel s3a10 TaxID=2009045 RepID=UPI000BA33861|nr:DUF4145 domain-containing protein [Pseudomonas sp. Irchel s3a10]